ncbi:transcriptional regulator LeuO [Vibrio barjaei]|uniref:transcriptional regulator LeuO n=1 Tax=Vibrio barjaei TaxID=1676683 RepID=UPI0022844FAA|nr:transcriptional regulator LeuO [Vibrio barjaei]MCY9870384.1 transcriptional regulator LeuO [Vibrio barjaei]
MSNLRASDLNLLPIFDTVMQQQNVTRAAELLDLSQPAVSNAVARLKVMFDDELFLRHGRGIRPTAKARELFGPIRQALQLVKNELPGAKFSPMTTQRKFKISVASPLDMTLGTSLISSIYKCAPRAELALESYNDSVIDDRLRFHEVDFSIGFIDSKNKDYIVEPLFKDELVVIASKGHPRITNHVTFDQFKNENHGQLMSVQNNQQFHDSIYSQIDVKIGFKSQNVTSLLKLVESTEYIAVLPASILTTALDLTRIQVLKTPFQTTELTCYLKWHISTDKDDGLVWLKNYIIDTIVRA